MKSYRKVDTKAVFRVLWLWIKELLILLVYEEHKFAMCNSAECILMCILFVIFACLILKRSKVHVLIIVNEYWLHG